MEISRRNFLQGAAIASGAAALGLTGCQPKAESAASGTAEDQNIPSDFTAKDIKDSSVELKPITKFAAEETYDIVVVGAGCSGVPAIMTTIEEGGTVGVLQRESQVAANGNGCSAIAKKHSTEAGIKRFKYDWCSLNDFRVNTTLFDFWINHSEETQSWIVQKTYEAGLAPVSFKTSASVVYKDGEVAAVFEATQKSNNDTMTAIAALAESKGAVFHYSTPAVQLVRDSSGAVTGVIGKRPDGSYIKMNANKGVILCAGDYQNNDSILSRLNGDLHVLWHKQQNRTGDGHILAGTAGARMVPVGHAKMIHGMIGAFMTTPLLVVDPEGNRFMNEDTIMTKWNGQILDHYPAEGDSPEIFRFFDAAVEKKYTDLKTTLAAVNAAYEKDGVASVSSQATYYRADTLEKLLQDAGLPASTMDTIKRYNEVVASGEDPDFGVRPGILKPLDTPPYYCIKDHPGLTAIAGGMKIDGHFQFVDKDGTPIPGLFGAGVNAGNICGGTNWNMPGGCSNAHCFTGGRYAAIYALTGTQTPSNPCTFEQVADHYVGKTGYFWENGKASSSIEVW